LHKALTLGRECFIVGSRAFLLAGCNIIFNEHVQWVWLSKVEAWMLLQDAWQLYCRSLELIRRGCQLHCLSLFNRVADWSSMQWRSNMRAVPFGMNGRCECHPEFFDGMHLGILFDNGGSMML